MTELLLHKPYNKEFPTPVLGQNSTSFSVEQGNLYNPSDHHLYQNSDSTAI